jgi:hypothetical protein
MELKKEYPSDKSRFIATVVIALVLAYFAGWGYTFAFLAGGALWSIKWWWKTTISDKTPS